MSQADIRSNNSLLPDLFLVRSCKFVYMSGRTSICLENNIESLPKNSNVTLLLSRFVICFTNKVEAPKVSAVLSSWGPPTLIP